MRTILIGNAGAGKTTLARRLIGEREIPHLSLDEIAWNEGIERRPLGESLRSLYGFLKSHDHWVIEGCYANLIQAALPYCSELRFLNPGVDACLANCLSRPWEPEKFPSAADQDALRTELLEWVKAYESRDDEFGLKRHRELFERFGGAKQEYTSMAAYAAE